MTGMRPATPTVAFIDQYCAHYRSLFSNARRFELFTALHRTGLDDILAWTHV